MSKIAGPFILAVAGDIVGVDPLAHLQDVAVQRVIRIIRNADVAFGNMNSNVSDHDTVTGQVAGLPRLTDIAADLKAQGFDVVLRASEQSASTGAERMLQSNRIIAEGGLVYAGSGRNLQEARSPAYHMSRKGRIGLVGMSAYSQPLHQAPYVRTSPSNGAAAGVATYQTRFRSGQPGVNPLRLHQAILVPQAELDALRRIAVTNNELAKKILAERRPLSSSHVPRLEMDTDPTSPVRLFTTTYALGDRGRQRLRMDADDERLNLRSVREATEAADFVIAAVHSYESAWTIPFDFLQSEPPNFMVTLAHEAIDNGADAFVGSGVQVLRGIEIYRGRPIFYGLMSYDGPVDRHKHHDGTDTESMESVVCEASFHDGALAEVRIYPIDLGQQLPVSQRGAPRLSTGEVAQRILTRMQHLSEPLGTRIAIQDDIGIISVGA